MVIKIVMDNFVQKNAFTEFLNIDFKYNIDLSKIWKMYVFINIF